MAELRRVEAEEEDKRADDEEAEEEKVAEVGVESGLVPDDDPLLSLPKDHRGRKRMSPGIVPLAAGAAAAAGAVA